MKRTFLFLLLAAVGGALAEVPAAGQVNPEAAPGPIQTPSYKYEVYGGFAYTSLNQVNLSRYGLIGGKGTVTRDFGKYFGLMAAGDYYKPPIKSASAGTLGNPGNPSVYSALIGPEIHAPLYGNLSGLFFAQVGMEHTGGEGMHPDTSFAGSFGGGMTYNLSPRFAIRATGDRIGASFSLNNNTTGGSAHKTWNARGTIGVVWRF